MNIGATFPQTQIGRDPERISTYARAVEDLGYRHILAYDHVLGANPDHPEFQGGYDYEDQFHEPLTLFGHLAAITEAADLVTGVLNLSQRQTALVAKQAAEVDVLSSGRFKVGAGTGWNQFEYEALGRSMENRGERIEEQIFVLRRLWTENLVSFDGEYHTLSSVGLNPRPVQQPVPIWLGGSADVVLRRVARIGDGWIPMAPPPDELASKLDRLESYLDDEGRSLDDLRIVQFLNLETVDPERWVDRASAFEDVGATDLSINTMRLDLSSVDEHIETLGRVRDTLEDSSITEGL